MQNKKTWLVKGNYAFYSYNGLFDDEYNMYNYGICKILHVENKNKILVASRIFIGYHQYAKSSEEPVYMQQSEFYVNENELAPLEFTEYTFEHAKTYLLGALLEYSEDCITYTKNHVELITSITTMPDVYINGKPQSYYMQNNYTICNMPFGYPKLIR